MSKAEVSWLDLKPSEQVGVIRGGPNFETYGDPYVFACTVIHEKGSSHARIIGFSGSLASAMDSRRAIRKALKKAGIFTAEWERRKPHGQKFVFTEG